MRPCSSLGRHVDRHLGPKGQGANHESGTDNEGNVEADSPETLASWAEFHEQVEQLPDDEREVFQLLWYSGTTQREAAELLDISERTVLRRYYRAKLSLRDTLQGADE